MAALVAAVAGGCLGARVVHAAQVHAHNPEPKGRILVGHEFERSNGVGLHQRPCDVRREHVPAQLNTPSMTKVQPLLTLSTGDTASLAPTSDAALPTATQQIPSATP